jgi:hypothetical protein
MYCRFRSFPPAIYDGPRATSLLEDELARFFLWTSYLKVFVEGRASLNHRLREALDVLQLVLGLLEALKHKVEDCQYYFVYQLLMAYFGFSVTWSTTACALNVCPSLETLQCESELGLMSYRPKFGAICRRFRIAKHERIARHDAKISNEINLLYRLMNSIRKPSEDLHYLKAAESFELLDKKGNNSEPTLQSYFLQYLKAYCRSNISEQLLARLAFSMIARRKRVQYRRSRYSRAPLTESTPAKMPVIGPTVQGISTDI